MIRNTPKTMALGTKLRAARESTGMSQRALAKTVGIDHSALSRNETGDRSPSIEEVGLILRALGVRGAEHDQIMSLARDTSGAAWQATNLPELRVQTAALLDLEQIAKRIVHWSPLIIPGLLQVSSYTRAIMRVGVPPSELETRVAVRMGRKDILTRPNPTPLTAMIGESALRQMIGGREVMAEQLRYLLTMGKLPNIDLRVIGTDTDWHPGLYGTFLVLMLDDTNSVLYLENVRSGVFVSDEDDVARYEAAALHMHSIAMSPEQSAELIVDHIKRIE